MTRINVNNAFCNDLNEKLITANNSLDDSVLEVNLMDRDPSGLQSRLSFLAFIPTKAVKS